jgi:Uma2 family endonuclease
MDMLQYAQRLFTTEKQRGKNHENSTLDLTRFRTVTEDGNRYEIIDGELYVAKQPDWQHQLVGFRLGFLLQVWNEQSQVSQLFSSL